MKPPATPTLRRFMAGLAQRNPGQPEYLQAVREVIDTQLFKETVERMGGYSTRDTGTVQPAA